MFHIYKVNSIIFLRIYFKIDFQFFTRRVLRLTIYRIFYSTLEDHLLTEDEVRVEEERTYRLSLLVPSIL